MQLLPGIMEWLESLGRRKRPANTMEENKHKRIEIFGISHCTNVANLIGRNHNDKVFQCVFLALGFAGSSTVESYLVPGAYSGTNKSTGKERIFDWNQKLHFQSLGNCVKTHKKDMQKWRQQTTSTKEIKQVHGVWTLADCMLFWSRETQQELSWEQKSLSKK